MIGKLATEATNHLNEFSFDEGHLWSLLFFVLIYNLCLVYFIWRTGRLNFELQGLKVNLKDTIADKEATEFYAEKMAMDRGWVPRDIHKKKKNPKDAIDHLFNHSEDVAVKYGKLVKNEKDKLNEMIREQKEEYDDIIQIKDAKIEELLGDLKSQTQYVVGYKDMEGRVRESDDIILDCRHQIQDKDKQIETLNKQVRQLTSGRDDLRNQLSRMRNEQLFNANRSISSYKNKTAKLRAMLRGDIPYELKGSRIVEKKEVQATAQKKKKATKKKVAKKKATKKKAVKKKAKRVTRG